MRFDIGDQVYWTCKYTNTKSGGTIVAMDRAVNSYLILTKHKTCIFIMDNELEKNLKENNLVYIKCTHKWKSTPGFMFNSVYIDCELCGCKQEEVKNVQEIKEPTSDYDILQFLWGLADGGTELP